MSAKSPCNVPRPATQIYLSFWCGVHYTVATDHAVQIDLRLQNGSDVTLRELAGIWRQETHSSDEDIACPLTFCDTITPGAAGNYTVTVQLKHLAYSGTLTYTGAILFATVIG